MLIDDFFDDVWSQTDADKCKIYDYSDYAAIPAQDAKELQVGLDSAVDKGWMLTNQIATKQKTAEREDAVPFEPADRDGHCRAYRSQEGCSWQKSLCSNGKTGVYTRYVGLDRDTNKELLLKHIRQNNEVGTPFKELQQVLPGLDRNQIRVLMRELRESGKVFCEGTTSAARWFASK